MEMPHRRSRMRRARTGKTIALTDRDLEIFRLLSGYRYLRSTYLHAFAGGASATRFKERLGDLFHEGYLDRPSEQWAFASARHAPCVYEIGSGARRALDAAGVPPGPVRTWLGRGVQKQFRHALMICECLASIELAARGRDDLRFIPWAEIAAKLPPKTAETALPFKLPLGETALIPDAIFGLEYRKGGKKTYRFFALEADRGTMPVARTREGQTSYLSKLAAYREIIERGLQRAHWGLPNLFVLTVTVEARRAEEIVRGLPTEQALFLFKAVAAAALCSPQPELLATTWMRAGFAPFDIIHG